MSLLTSILTGGVNNHPTTSEEANFYNTDFVNSGVVGTIANTNSVAPMTGGFAVNAQGTPDMTVAVTVGAAYLSATPSGQNSQKLRVRLTANENVTIASNSSGSTKYDWVYIKIDPTLAAAPTLAGDTVATLVTSRSSSSTTDNGTPPTYGLNIAVVTVANGASSISNSAIRDTRVQASTTSVDTSITTGWLANQLPAVSSVTANGNRSYDITFASSVASTLSTGVRLRTTRTSNAPTQCTSLNGTTQYWSKTTPNKLTFTDDFVVSAWVKLTSYAQGVIASRYNGTSGWELRVDATGQLTLIGYNGGAGNYSLVLSYQSLPLNRWIHVAAQLDMSSFTATTTTSYIMLDGKDVPCAVSRAGTNPTALVQAGNLEIGARNSGTTLFPGKIAQLAIYNAKVTQATILASISQGLSGSETSLASAYSFSGAATDLNTTTPNDLSASGSATTTNSDSPFGNGGTSATLDYALVMAISTTTATVQVPEGCTIPSTGGVSAVAYATQGNPYGWVDDKSRWLVRSISKITMSQTNPVLNTFYNLNFNISVPVGNWSLGFNWHLAYGKSTAADTGITIGLSTSTSSFSDDYLAAFHYGFVSAGGIVHTDSQRSNGISLSSATTYYTIIKAYETLTTSNYGLRADSTTAFIIAEPTGL